MQDQEGAPFPASVLLKLKPEHYHGMLNRKIWEIFQSEFQLNMILQ